MVKADKDQKKYIFLSAKVTEEWEEGEEFGGGHRYLGFLHKMELGRPSMVCDFIELYRHLVDGFLIEYCKNLRSLQFSVIRNRNVISNGQDDWERFHSSQFRQIS
jgi:hypothetical protein